MLGEAPVSGAVGLLGAVVEPVLGVVDRPDAARVLEL
jgi:hypothetical protein